MRAVADLERDLEELFSQQAHSRRVAALRLEPATQHARLWPLLLAATAATAIIGFGALLASVRAPQLAEPAAATSATPQPSATIPFESPRVLLELAIGAGDLPGATPAAPGGVTARGPQSVMVDGSRTYLWDEANLRVLVYAGRNQVGSVALPNARVRSVALVVAAGKFYLREQDDAGTAIYEDEFDGTTGVRLRTASLRSGDTSLYPRKRQALGTLPSAKGTKDQLGVDTAGNTYERVFAPQCAAASCGELHRVGRNGSVLASASLSDAQRYEDFAVAADGSVYALIWIRDANNRILGITIVQLLTIP